METFLYFIKIQCVHLIPSTWEKPLSLKWDKRLVFTCITLHTLHNMTPVLSSGENPTLGCTEAGEESETWPRSKFCSSSRERTTDWTHQQPEKSN